MNFLTLFIILSIVNVILSTIRSLTTIKSGKVVASLVSGIYYSYYTIVIVYTVADYSLFVKCLITFICNLVGVFVVKLVEEKARKDRLWKIEMTCKGGGAKTYALAQELRDKGISTSYIELNNGYTQLTSYCTTQAESRIVYDFVKEHNCKYFITENKGVLY